MDEIFSVIAKYKGVDWKDKFSSPENLKAFSTQFYRDVAEVFDAITRIRNVGRNPEGFNLNDAAILGLLVRIWKLMKEMVRYYEANNGQMIGMFDRPIVEAAVTATYLMKSDDVVIEDYRKISYKDRLRFLDEAKAGQGYAATPAGRRFEQAIIAKMKAEGLTPDSFEQQKKNKWRLSGKTFRDIFELVEPPAFYKLLYGVGSESIHGTWQESLNFDLTVQEDGSFMANPFDVPVDVRSVTPIVRVATEPYMLWLQRIESADENLGVIFRWIESVNAKLFNAIEAIIAENHI